MIAKRVIDWDEIGDAVFEFGEYKNNAAYSEPTKAEHERDGFDATMVKIHNEIRKAQQ